MGMLMRRHRAKPAAAPAEVVGAAPAVADMTVKQLRAYAAEQGIDLGGAKVKADLVEVIIAAEQPDADEVSTGGEGQEPDITDHESPDESDEPEQGES